MPNHPDRVRRNYEPAPEPSFLSPSHIAEIAHMTNRAYCATIGDSSQPLWDDASGWQRESALSGVYLLLGDSTLGPEATHESWMRDKLDAGWTYGPVKDADLKTHPCMVPFSRLPREQQAKDALFQAVVRALAPYAR